jgi:hypothetical protein
MKPFSACIDRRAQYYSRIAPAIAADPLDFYLRAEKGRHFLAEQLGVESEQSPQLRVVTKYLRSAGELPAANTH